MKKFVGVMTVSTVLMLALPVAAMAAGIDSVQGSGRGNGGSLTFAPQLTASACDTHGSPVINVKEKVLNNADSGTAGNWWGLDTMNRTIKVWDLGNGTFCVTVNDTGSSYQALAGQQSPGNTGVLSGDEKGKIQGGYRGIITGTLLTVPTWSKHGSVGTVDYACDANGNCPGYVSWLAQYFAPGYGFDYSFWGWIYTGRGHTWVNACGADIPSNPACVGNSGDII